MLVLQTSRIQNVKLNYTRCNDLVICLFGTDAPLQIPDKKWFDNSP